MRTQYIDNLNIATEGYLKHLEEVIAAKKADLAALEALAEHLHHMAEPDHEPQVWAPGPRTLVSGIGLTVKDHKPLPRMVPRVTADAAEKELEDGMKGLTRPA